jgi:serine/threonine-protein kinase HipA
MVLLRGGLTPQVSVAQADLREISYAELSQRIRETPRIPFSVRDGKVRMSIAGFQNKLPVRLDQDKRIWLGDGAIASTHILKPQTANCAPHQAINEYFCKRLARAAGIASAPVEMIRVPEPVLEPDRYFSVKHIFVKRKKDEQEDLPK